MINYYFNKINLDIKNILRSELQAAYDVIDSDLKVAMIHMMYI